MTIETPTATPKSGISLSDTISVGGKTVSVADLLTGFSRLTELETRLKATEEGFKAAVALTDPDVTPEAHDAALRTFLRAQGQSDIDIEESVQAVNATRATGGDLPPVADADDESDDTTQDASAMTSKEIEALRADLRASRADTIKTRLREQIASILDSNAEAGVLLKAAKQSGEGKLTAAKASLATELQDATIRSLMRTHQSGAPLSLEAVDTALRSTAKNVFEKYLGFQPASSAGNAPAVPEGFEMLSKAQPVEAPVPGSGQTLGETQSSLDAFINDSLSRGLMEDAVASTKV